MILKRKYYFKFNKKDIRATSIDVALVLLPLNKYIYPLVEKLIIGTIFICKTRGPFFCLKTSHKELETGYPANIMIT